MVTAVFSRALLHELRTVDFDDRRRVVTLEILVLAPPILVSLAMNTCICWRNVFVQLTGACASVCGVVYRNAIV